MEEVCRAFGGQMFQHAETAWSSRVSDGLSRHQVPQGNRRLMQKGFFTSSPCGEKWAFSLCGETSWKILLLCLGVQNSNWPLQKGTGSPDRKVCQACNSSFFLLDCTWAYCSNCPLWNPLGPVVARQLWQLGAMEELSHNILTLPSRNEWPSPRRCCYC